MLYALTLTLLLQMTSNITLYDKTSLSSSYATYYADSFEGKRTATGELFTQHKMTGASNKYYGQNISVCRGDKCVRIYINDRCGRCNLDLSKSAFKQLGNLSEGRIKVNVK